MEECRRLGLEEVLPRVRIILSQPHRFGERTWRWAAETVLERGWGRAPQTVELKEGLTHEEWLDLLDDIPEKTPEQRWPELAAEMQAVLRKITPPAESPLNRILADLERVRKAMDAEDARKAARNGSHGTQEPAEAIDPPDPLVSQSKAATMTAASEAPPPREPMTPDEVWNEMTADDEVEDPNSSLRNRGAGWFDV